MVKDVGFRVQGLGFRVEGLWCRDHGLPHARPVPSRLTLVGTLVLHSLSTAPPLHEPASGFRLPLPREDGTT